MIAAILLALGAGACSSSGSQSDDSDPPASTNTTSITPAREPDAPSEESIADAAANAAAAIALEDDLGTCPLGSPTTWTAAAEAAGVELLSANMAESIDNGQVYSGGTVDITYCEILTRDHDTPVEELRISVSPTADVDLDAFLDEQHGNPRFFEIAEVEGFADGRASTMCREGSPCIAAWQADGLFVAVAAVGPDVTQEMAIDLARALVPTVVDTLAR